MGGSSSRFSSIPCEWDTTSFSNGSFTSSGSTYPELWLNPDVAARLDFTTLEFLDKELFTDFPEGSVREADVVDS